MFGVVIDNENGALGRDHRTRSLPFVGRIRGPLDDGGCRPLAGTMAATAEALHPLHARALPTESVLDCDMADLRNAFRWRPEVALASRKLTHVSYWRPASPRQSFCRGLSSMRGEVCRS